MGGVKVVVERWRKKWNDVSGGRNTILIIMREFHDFEKIQIRSSRADLHHRLGI